MIPNLDYQLYTILTTFFIFMFAFKGKPKLNKYTNFLFLIIAYLVATSIIRLILSGEFHLRDFNESARFLPFMILFLYKESFSKLKLSEMIDSLLVYTIFDLVVSLLQKLRFDWLGVIRYISNLYNSPKHIAISYELNDRILGLSSGPGQHGVIFAMIFVLVFTCMLFFRIDKIKSSIILAGSLIIVMLSQSRTSFIALLLSIIVLIPCYIMINKKTLSNSKNKVLFLVFSIISMVSIMFNTKRLKYLFSIFNFEKVIHSLSKRINKASTILNIGLDENPLLIIFGYGKQFFGTMSSAMDNEYLYFILVYGVVPTVIFLYIALKQITDTISLLSRRIVSPNIVLSLILIFGLVVSFAGSFYADLRATILLAFIILLVQSKDIFVLREFNN